MTPHPQIKHIMDLRFSSLGFEHTKHFTLLMPLCQVMSTKALGNVLAQTHESLLRNAMFNVYTKYSTIKVTLPFNYEGKKKRNYFSTIIPQYLNIKLVFLCIALLKR